MSEQIPTKKEKESETYRPTAAGFEDWVFLEDKDGEKFAIPKFFTDPIDQMVLEQESRRCSRTDYQWPGAQPRRTTPGVHVAAGDVVYAANPRPSPTAIKTVHTEIICNMKRRRISYKDAAHRLYLAELAAVRAHHMALAEFVGIKMEIDAIIDSDLCAPLQKIREGHPDALNPVPGEILEVGPSANIELEKENRPTNAHNVI